MTSKEQIMASEEKGVEKPPGRCPIQLKEEELNLKNKD